MNKKLKRSNNSHYQKEIQMQVEKKQNQSVDENQVCDSLEKDNESEEFEIVIRPLNRQPHARGVLAE